MSRRWLHATMAEESPGTPHVAAPAEPFEARLQRGGLIEDLHDIERPPIVQLPLDHAGPIDRLVVRRGLLLSEHVVDEERLTVGLERRSHHAPEVDHAML